MLASQQGKGPGKLTLGTAEHYYHTLAGGVNVWTDGSPGSQLGVLVRRMAEPYSTNISQQEIFKYWEAMLAGQPLFPDGIKMLVGSFSQLFGTANGRRLQAWCKKEGWVLMWALGEVGADPPAPGSPNGMDMGAPYANRSLDLQVLAHSSAAHNISITNERRLEFDGLWLDVAAALNGSLTCATPPLFHPTTAGFATHLADSVALCCADRTRHLPATIQMGRMALALRRPHPHSSFRTRIGATSGAVCLLRRWLGFSTKAVAPTRARASGYESAMAVAFATTTDCIGDLGDLGRKRRRRGHTERKIRAFSSRGGQR